MPSPRGTLRADAQAYLRAVAAMPSIAERQRDLEDWLPRFGQRSRWSLRPEEIRAQLAEWRAAGLAASTCNHRRTALSHLFTVLDGKSAYNPVRDVPMFPAPPPLRRGVPMRVISAIFDAMPECKTKARLRVLAWTGMRPIELMRLEPWQVDVRARVIRVQSKRGPVRDVALNAEAVRALRAFMMRDAWGAWSLASARKILHRACLDAGVEKIRVYDLRHSHGTALRAVGADLADVAAQLGHADQRMTKRYAPTIPEKLQIAVRKLRPVKIKAG